MRSGIKTVMKAIAMPFVLIGWFFIGAIMTIIAGIISMGERYDEMICDIRELWRGRRG